MVAVAAVAVRCFTSFALHKQTEKQRDTRNTHDNKKQRKWCMEIAANTLQNERQRVPNVALRFRLSDRSIDRSFRVSFRIFFEKNRRAHDAQCTMHEPRATAANAVGFAGFTIYGLRSAIYGLRFTIYRVRSTVCTSVVCSLQATARCVCCLRLLNGRAEQVKTKQKTNGIRNETRSRRRCVVSV